MKAFGSMTPLLYSSRVVRPVAPFYLLAPCDTLAVVLLDLDLPFLPAKFSISRFCFSLDLRFAPPRGLDMSLLSAPLVLSSYSPVCWLALPLPRALYYSNACIV